MASLVTHHLGITLSLHHSTKVDLEQEQVQELYYQQVLPALRETLVELDNIGTNRPEKVAVDLEKLSLASSHEALKSILRQEILLQANTAKAQLQTLQKSAQLPGSDDFEVLTSFLQKGKLPWHYKHATKFSLTHLLNDFYSKRPVATIWAVRNALRSEAARQRLINQCSVKEVFLWILRFANLQQLTNYSLLEDWIKLLQQRIFSTAVTRKLLELLLRESVHVEKCSSAAMLIAKQLLLVRDHEQKKVTLLANHLINIKPDLNIQDRLLLESSANPDALPHPALSVSSEENRGDLQLHIEDFRMPVKNAGLVLLHLFLKPYLLNATGLAEDKLELPENRLQAAQLLHYLCTGQTGTPEHDLVFNKIVCGVPLYQAVPAKLSITPEASKATEELLNVIITHWSILKSSSSEHLRANFLMRNGLLERNTSGWVLRIEKKEDDVLAEQYPWGIKQLFTPFDKQLITLSW